MVSEAELEVAISRRVVAHEMARRIPGWDGPPVILARGLPPLALLAARAYPPQVLERRLRFLRAMGWDPPLPPEAAVEDQVALRYFARAVGPDAAEERSLSDFFDREADDVDPLWRAHPTPGPNAASAWAQGEAARLRGGRFLGCHPARWLRRLLSPIIWCLAEQKRRWWD